MNYLHILFKALHYQHIDELVVSRLYSLSIKSITAVVIFSLILSYYLYPELSAFIIIWELLLVFISLLRIYLAFLKNKDSDKFTLNVWYKIFVALSFSTAALFALIGSFGLFYLDEVRQLFLVTVLIGLTSGAMSSLFLDIRILIGYISIILLPLIITLFSTNTQMHIILAFLLIIYFITQIIIIINTYRQNCELDIEKEKIYEEQLELNRKEKALEYFFEQAPIGIFSYDCELNVTDCNKSFLDLFGLKREDIIGKNLENLPDKRSIYTIKNALKEGVQIYVGPYISLKGFEFWVEAKCFPVYKNNNIVVGGIGLIENKTKEHTAVKDLKYLAQHDPLTSLLNRRGLKEYMHEFMQKEEHKYSYSLLVYLDLNKFKHINDSLGHKVGDKLLISISKRLKIFTDDDCIISRFGGDEFIIVSSFIAKNKIDAEERATDCIEKIKKAFKDLFTIDDMNLSISTSFGIVIIEPNTFNIDEIIRYADIALYQAKQSTTDYTSFYDTKLDKERKKLFMLQHDLRNASKNNELKLYLQPLVTMKEENLIAAECLVRWKHPKLGLLYPNEFISMAVETGLISDITWWVIEEVCQYISKLKKDNIWYLNYISININAKQLLLNHFVQEFLDILNKYELNSSDILIEVTERSLIDNFEDAQYVINILRKRGIKCAIDDFGVGYSSLSYLKKLSFDTLKIDKEFIKDIHKKPDDITLVKTILEIGKQFNYNIVVEGIEEERQKEILLKIDEDIVYQGFLFSKAIPCEEFTKKYLNS
jgi:diguanylate cyclase (GGDEF)-like protein/PAS domain S-box-containing protein